MSDLRRRFPDQASLVRQVLSLRARINELTALRDEGRITAFQRIQLMQAEADEDYYFGRLDDLYQRELDDYGHGEKAA